MNEDKRNENRKNSDNFIMLPTVDFCFKELMKNSKVRKDEGKSGGNTLH